MDWSILDLRIAGERSAKDGLRKRRAALEKIVAPYVTKQETADTILFKGKRRYATPVNKCDNENEIAWNIYALECLYEIEAAWKEGNIERAISAAVGFGRCDDEALKCKLFKSDSWNFIVNATKGRMTGGRNTKELASESEVLLLKTTFENHRDAPKDRYQKTAQELFDRHGIKSRRGRMISAKTIRRRLKELGILDSSSVVSGQR